MSTEFARWSDRCGPQKFRLCQGESWRYRYRAVDSAGSTIDFWLSIKRDAAAAKRFFHKALEAPNHPRPRVITVDGNPSYPKVIAELKQERRIGAPVSLSNLSVLE